MMTSCQSGPRPFVVSIWTVIFTFLIIMQRAIMDENFKNYLEQKGLHEVQMFQTAVPAVFGVMSKCVANVSIIWRFYCNT